ncbi:MAG: YggS family pyridoxal phosphate-dependent enzyme [Halioglobus sp.]|nr:YggS family pyridoxal phosphate-dependent enzyme [Halioglobus sp.]
MDEQQLSKNIAKLRERVRRVAEKSQIGNSTVRIVAVSKTRSAQEIRAAHACGLTDFGESYLQEALQKISELSDLPLVWHFIGPIQSNKTSGIATHFDWVHSVDRARVARRLSEQRPPQLPPLQVCLQVNISGEASKSGVSLEELPQLARTVCELPHLKLRGLMAIPAAEADTSQQQEAFRQMRGALAGIQALGPEIDTLSMGMSADMEIAIMEGATTVRVGTGIFGPRNR